MSVQHYIKMESGVPDKLENHVEESLDARVFNPPTELEEVAPPLPERPKSVTDPYSQASGNLPPSAPKVPGNGTVPKISPQPQIPAVPHLPSKYAETYELEKFNENRMIIFNHDEFLNASPRPGTQLDEACLRRTLEQFRFKIDPSYNNLKKKELIDTVKKFALKTNFSKYGCVWVVIMTHGWTKKPGFLSAYDEPYNEHEIYEHFDASKNPSLAAKPVIFIIQACRGADPSPIIAAMKNCMFPSAQLDDGENKEFYHLPMDADRLVFHSAYIGRASVRHPQHGSWFIQTLCKKISEYALTHDLETIFRLVRREVALDHIGGPAKKWKQMPVVSSTAIREIRLAPNVSPQTDSKDMVDFPAHSLNGNILAKEPKELKAPDEIPDNSLILLQPYHMPCSCFLEYFEYLKQCLRTFVEHNANDGVANNLLTMVERAGDGAEYNLLKFSYIRSVREHFDTNQHKFPPEAAAFFHRLYD